MNFIKEQITLQRVRDKDKLNKRVTLIRQMQSSFELH